MFKCIYQNKLEQEQNKKGQECPQEGVNVYNLIKVWTQNQGFLFSYTPF